VIAPQGAAPDGGRPIMAWAHGTTGTAQSCGPSQVLDPAQDLNQYFLVGGTSWTDFGVPALSEFIGKGYVVVATDYQGLGGGGRHQYAISATQGRDVINSIRAVGSMGLSGQARKAAVYGWSQGGGATLSAAGLADYVRKTGTAFDGIEVVGFVAFAPQDVAVMIPKGALDAAAANALLQDLAKTFSDNVFNFTHFAMMMWAMAATFPEVELSDLFSAEGANGLNAIFSKKCMHAAADTMNFTFGEAYKSFLQQKPARPEQWVKALVEGSVAPVKPIAPVIIYWGTKDTVVPPAMGQLYREQMCGMGGNVSRVQLPGEQTHFSTPGAAKSMYVDWIADRFAGKQAADGCKPN
ncbi:MAG: alpha/beta fold hydrolase, partial [Pseudorhodoplanes sp.]